QLIIDETTAMSIARDKPEQSRFAFWATGAALFCLWNLGTLIGALATQALPDPKALGLDAAPPAAFLALLAPRLRPRAPLAAARAAHHPAAAGRAPGGPGRDPDLRHRPPPRAGRPRRRTGRRRGRCAAPGPIPCGRRRRRGDGRPAAAGALGLLPVLCTKAVY